VLHDVREKERRCGCCGKKLVEIGRITSEQAEYVPASVHVKKHVRVKYGCPDTDCRGTVLLADVPPMAVPKCKAAPGMLAYVAFAKYGHHLPLFRLEEILALHGLPVSRTTLWEWIWGAAGAFVTVYEAMKKEVQGSPVISSDETPVRLWDREHKVMKQGRQWVYINPDHTVFEFSVDRKKKHPEAFLSGSKGVVLSDAYAGYRSVAEANGALINAFCWAHVRRQYFKAQDTDRARAIVAMAYIKALYRVESEGKGMTPSKLKRLRRTQSAPILEEFKKWIQEQGQMVLPKSPIGKAMAYTTNNWKELLQFLEDGRVRLDNNISEQQLRPIAVGRKNWQRNQSERGGKAAAILSSLIASCRRHMKNPFEYLKDVLERIPTHPAREILELTPARWKPRLNTS
jgi:transposase